MSRMPFIVLLLSVSCSAGCIDLSSSPSADNPPAKPPATENSGQGIFGKTTQDIGEYDKNKANQVASDQKIHATDPITAPLSAYGPMTERISMTQITSAVNLFHAENERYPKDLDEFMEKIVKPNNIRLPVLPYKGRYEYNVEKHELMIVRDAEDARKQ
jgi:hypothetical protein